MYKVFMILPNGHVLTIGQFDYEDNAIREADYHRQYCGVSDASFEVCFSGKTLYRT